MAFKVILRFDGAAKDRLDGGHDCKNHVPHVRQGGTLGHAPHQAYFPGIESGVKGTIDISQRVFWDNAAMDETLNFADFPMQAAILQPMEG